MSNLRAETLLGSAFDFLLLEQCEEFAQFGSELFQSLSLFCRAWCNCARVTSFRWWRCKHFAFVEFNRRAFRLTVFLSADDFQFSTAAKLIREPLLCSSDRVLIFVKQFLDAKRHFHVALAIDALAGAILLRREHGKLRFPVAQDMRLHTRELANLPDLEEQLFGNGYSRATH